MYALVLLTPLSPGAVDIDHEPFIDSLIDRGLVLLGGSVHPSLRHGVTAAYVLRCSDLAQAQSVVAEDPLVSSGACRAEVAVWDVVGIDLGAVDPRLASGEAPGTSG